MHRAKKLSLSLVYRTDKECRGNNHEDVIDGKCNLLIRRCRSVFQGRRGRLKVLSNPPYYHLNLTYTMMHYRQSNDRLVCQFIKAASDCLGKSFKQWISSCQRNPCNDKHCYLRYTPNARPCIEIECMSNYSSYLPPLQC